MSNFTVKNTEKFRTTLIKLHTKQFIPNIAWCEVYLLEFEYVTCSAITNQLACVKYLQLAAQIETIFHLPITWHINEHYIHNTSNVLTLSRQCTYINTWMQAYVNYNR